jgi:hypothetical protein
MQNPICGECGKSLAELRLQVLRQVRAEIEADIQAEAEAEAEDDIRYLLETSINPELDLFYLQHGLEW